MNTTAHDMNREKRVLDVFERHVAAFTSGDLEAVLSDFGEHSVVFTPDGIFEGLDQIRTLYQGLLTEFGIINQGDSPGFAFDLVHVRHDILFITWQAQSMNHVFPYGTDTFVFKDNKFDHQSIAYSPPQTINGSTGAGKRSTS